ncbi:hypothetical protein [Gemmatimonas sp. UBA7669]|uniref:hypothetical protein n=1 Tax=Gemmatimonas sp. UBA7669 TaxID=1946568 RepID=UPI0025BD35FF|nr:hypothetical protein [Gemmatimonas sp. UBA7669]
MPVPTPVTLEWLYDVTAAAPAAREADMRGYSDTRLLEEHAQAGAQRRQLLVAHATTSEAGDALESRASLRALEWATQELLLLERVIGERGVVNTNKNCALSPTRIAHFGRGMSPVRSGLLAP